MVQLQRQEPDGRRIPVFNLLKKSHVLDPKEAVVEDDLGSKIAVFRSSPKHRRRLKLGSSDSPHHTPAPRYASPDEHDCVGQVDVISKEEGITRWRINKVSRGYEFTHVFGNEEFSLRWTKHGRSQTDRVTGVNSARYSLPARSDSDSSIVRARKSPVSLSKSLSLSSGSWGAGCDWVCRFNDPGSSRGGLKIARLKSEELTCFFPAHSRIATPARVTACQVSSALWVLLHTTEQGRPPIYPGPSLSYRSPSYKAVSGLAGESDRAMSIRRSPDDTDNGDVVQDASQISRQISQRRNAPGPVNRHSMRSDATAVDLDLVKGTTKSPTCLTFLQSFKIFAPRSARQGLRKHENR